MNKQELAMKLLKQTEVAYEIHYTHEEDMYFIGWSNDTGLYGNYQGNDEEEILQHCEINKIIIQ